MVVAAAVRSWHRSWPDVPDPVVQGSFLRRFTFLMWQGHRQPWGPGPGGSGRSSQGPPQSPLPQTFRWSITSVANSLYLHPFLLKTASLFPAPKNFIMEMSCIIHRSISGRIRGRAADRWINGPVVPKCTHPFCFLNGSKDSGIPLGN